MAIGSALSVGLIGLKAFIIQIQAFVSPRTSLLLHHRTSRHLTFRSEGTCQIRMPSQRRKMAGDTSYGQSFAGIHAQTWFLS